MWIMKRTLEFRLEDMKVVSKYPPVRTSMLPNKHVSTPYISRGPKRNISVPSTVSKGNQRKQRVTKGNQVTDKQTCKHPPNAASGLTTNTCLFVPGGVHDPHIHVVHNLSIHETESGNFSPFHIQSFMSSVPGSKCPVPLPSPPVPLTRFSNPPVTQHQLQSPVPLPLPRCEILSSPVPTSQRSF